MPTAEDRQAKALEELARSNKEMVKIFMALNENVVGMFGFIRDQIAKDEAEGIYGVDQVSIDDMRARAEKDRAERAEYEESARKPTLPPFRIPGGDQ